MRKTISIAAAMCLVAAVAVAQEEEVKKPLSPLTKAEATFGGKKLTVDYSAPSKRDRVIMGGLVPYGKVWRTGANAATTLTTETSIMLGNLAVPAGTYSLFTIPGEKEWTVIVNKQTGQSGTRYDETQDVGRVKVPVAATKAPVETFTIDLESSSAKAGALTMAWENTSISVPVKIR